ncbi:MAG TPA: dihydrolipoamide acetyltransferase family protein [candidate division Zixibacteria bacterium]|nr:dihydrolipoamide acetyltransferase family protein [candidate division Zixibacteria bacterium]
MSEFRMPSLGADMQFGTVVEWRVKPGDAVKHGDVVALVETEKGVIEVEIFENGVVESLVVQPGQKVPVGTTLATLSGDGKKVEAPSTTPAAIAPAPPAPVKEEAAPVKIPIVPATEPSVRLRISPLARKRAQELGIEPSRLIGSGADGSITVADVERSAEGVKPAAPAVAPAAGAAKGLDLAAMRRVIAAAMARSKREIPHYYLSTTIDMRKSLDWLAAENAKRPVTKRLLYSVLLIRAVALALRSTPELNGFWVDDGFKAGEGIHVGVAISLRQGGLVNPAIHDVDKKNLDELMENMLDLVNRARTGHLRSSELADGTITVTNLGEQGVESVFGVIYPPQVALVGFGKIVERPVALNGLLGVRPVIEATLAADHRVSDGHRGGRFLLAIDRLLQEPETL